MTLRTSVQAVASFCRLRTHDLLRDIGKVVVTLFFSGFSHNLKVTLLALRFALRLVLIHLINQLHTSACWRVLVACVKTLSLRVCFPHLVTRSSAHILAKASKRILRVQSSPTTSWGSVKSRDLPTSCSRGSEHGIFILLHAHCYTRAARIHTVLSCVPDPKINVLLALSDGICHVGSTTEINVILITLADITLGILLLEL
jgi:hypothetical protein